MKNTILIFLIFCCSEVSAQHQGYVKLPVEQVDFRIHDLLLSDSLHNSLQAHKSVNIKKLKDGIYHTTIEIETDDSNAFSDLSIPLTIELPGDGELLAAEKSFHWVPNIKKEPGNMISEHVFRSPCMIFTLKKHSVVFVPDIGEMQNNQSAPYYMDLNFGFQNIQINYGMSGYRVERHQYYTRSNSAFKLNGKLNIGFYVLISDPDPLMALKAANDFLWKKFATVYTRSYLPQTVSFESYADTGYSMALEHYWVQTTDPQKGGITLSTYLDEGSKKYAGRDFKNDLWYHSWFNNARTAYGLYYWGRALNHDNWQDKATQSLKLILNAPDDRGWFPTIYVTEENRWISSGQGGNKDVYHLPDNVWTAYWIMRFDDELKKMEGTDQFLQRFSNALLESQNADGSFPARINVASHKADTVLQSSATSAMATWYLEEMILRNKIQQPFIEKYRKSILRSLEFLSKSVLPGQRFEDFELYFSCSPKPMYYFDSTTHLYGQNTLSIQWCAEANLQAYNLFKDKKYLRQGEYCLNILSLYQQVWNPPFINMYAFGGFGVQNTDAEWSDARQAQFAETYLHYFLATHSKEYLERAVYACRASFALMVLPENKNVCPENYQGTAMNGESWSGNMAENFGHGGFNERSNQSGFHWGTGSALTTAAIFHGKLGDLYIDNTLAIGVNGNVVKTIKRNANSIDITTEKLNKRKMKLVVDREIQRSQISIDGVKY